MKVVGLDLSLTSSGVAMVAPVDGLGLTCLPLRVTSKAPTTARSASTGKPTPPTLGQRAARLERIADSVLSYCIGADLVVVEQPAYSRTAGSMHDRSGLWWLVVSQLLRQSIPVAEVAPTARAKYATGNGGAGKDHVLASVVRRYADVEVSGNDEADALVLAAMGARHLGRPLEERIPATHLTAMTKVVWPQAVLA